MRNKLSLTPIPLIPLRLARLLHRLGNFRSNQLAKTGVPASTTMLRCTSSSNSRANSIATTGTNKGKCTKGAGDD